MTLTYRTSGPWGFGKGSNLTAAEIDGNTHDLAERLEAIEADAPEPNQISNITQSGNTITIHLEDGSSFGPFVLPRPVQRPTIAANVSAGTLTPSDAQASYYFRCTAAGGCAVTLPANADVAFAVDVELHFCQRGAGAVTFAGASGVTLNIPDGFESYTAGVGAVVTAKMVAIDEWDIFGLLAESA